MRSAFFSLVAVLALIAMVLAATGIPVQRTQSAPAEGIAFEQGDLDIANPGFVTALTFGPDGRLYVADLTGIYALMLDDTGTQVIDRHDIATDLHAVLGLAFDPTSSESFIYASRLDPDATPGFRSIISRFNIYDGLRQDVITGLPDWQGFEHFTDGIAFDASGKLYIGQGATTDAGGYDSPLAGAILVADVHAPGFSGTVTYQHSGDYLEQTSGDVRVFAPGLRNPYGIIVHSNGYIYATDNGPTGSAAPLSCPPVPFSTSPESTADELNLIEQDHYYGFPNFNRGRSDPRQCVYRAPEDPSTQDYTAPIFVANDDCRLCESVAEYTGGAFGGAMKGDLVLDSLMGGVWRAHLSADGRHLVSMKLLATFGSTLGIAVGPTGIIYAGTASNGHAAISYLRPAAAGPPTPSPASTVTETPRPRSPTPSAAPSSTGTPTVTPTPTRRREGDVDCSGTTDSRDAALILQLDAGMLAALPCQSAGDISEDGMVNSIDAALALQCDAGLLVCRLR